MQIAEGIAVLHDNEIVHRDIKPQNILRCDDAWKIADFGISKFTNKPVTGYTFQGAHTQPWAPPEQIQGAQAAPSADIYSFGKVMLFLLSGKPDLDEKTDLDKRWWEIIQSCLDFDPNRRPDIASIRTQLSEIDV